MITETKKIYKCEFCKKLYQRKYACERHEKMCYSNPANDRPCLHCQHLRKQNVAIPEYTGYAYFNREYELFYCDMVNTFLFQPQTEIKGNAFSQDDLECENVPMPKECEYYKTSLISEMLSRKT